MPPRAKPDGGTSMADACRSLVLWMRHGLARGGTIQHRQRYKLFLIGARLEVDWRMFGFGLDF